MPLKRICRKVFSPLKIFYKAKIITVEPIVFLFALGKLLYLPIVEQYYYQYYGAEILSNQSVDIPNGSYCINSSFIDEDTRNDDSYKSDESQSNHLVVYTHLASSLPAVLVAILMGSVTDRYGRKMGILLPSIGFFVVGLCSTLIIYFNLHPYYLIPVNFISGLMGDFTTLIAACFTYVADVSSMRWRSFRMAAVEGIFAFGKVLGQLGGGYWLHAVNCNFIPLMIFYTATTVAMIIYTFFIPESYTRAERKKLVSKNRGSFLKKYLNGARLYCGSLSFSTWMLYVVTVALSIAVINVQGSYVISVYFLKDKHFDFNPLQIGYYQALKSATQGIFSLLFFLFVFCKVSDATLLLIGSLISGLCNLLTGLADSTWELYTIASVQGFEGTIFASGRGLASKGVKPEEQGSLFSIIASVESLCTLFAFTFWPYIFPITLEHHMRPGSIYIFMGVLAFMIVPFIISLLLMNWKPTIMRDTIETSHHGRRGHRQFESSTSSSSSTSTSSNASDDDAEYQPLLNSAQHSYSHVINR